MARPSRYLVMLGAALVTDAASANLCGTDYQNFNPTTGGLDFVTVHSSETLSPCVINTGLFFNYAKNTLTYSRDGAGFFAGQKVEDSMWGADLSLGYGLTKNWDAGATLQFVAASDVKNPFYTSYFQKNGLTDVKLNTKYRLLGDETGGLAGVASVNFNQIKDNPYVGEGAGPTLNLELAADTTFSDIAFGLNVGYRKRQPGTQVAGVPFSPYKDQFIYSGAVSYLFRSLDTKVIFELLGARPAQAVDSGVSERSQSSLEYILGVKHDLRQDVALHFGGGTKIQNGTASPDYRVYFGLNWAFGPICEDKKMPERIQPPPKIRELEDLPLPPPVEPEPEPPPTVDDPLFNDPGFAAFEVNPKYTLVRLSAEVLFDFNSDQLRKGANKILDKVAAHLMRTGFHRVRVEGHTDSIGTQEYNQGLSERRARSVKIYLGSRMQVVPGDRLESAGFGESKPIADNGNYQGRQRNRRVEFRVFRESGQEVIPRR